eukprot:6206739-Pleurochrysis_carterae.AAC.1
MANAMSGLCEKSDECQVRAGAGRHVLQAVRSRAMRQVDTRMKNTQQKERATIYRGRGNGLRR